MKGYFSFLIFAFCVLFVSSCTPKNHGFISLVNSNVTPITISVDNRDFKVFPSNHITKEIGEGTHKIKVDSGAPMNVQITRNKTTLFDSTGLSCFVVADFTDRYNSGNVKIVERFFHERIFTANDEMITLLGSYLPKKLIKAKRALRIQQVDCETINDDNELAASLAHVL